MISKVEARELINDLFEEEALALGGLVAVHEIEDDLVWRLVRNLDVIRVRVLKRIDGDEEKPSTNESIPRPHPAIEDFLASVRGA